MTATPRLMLPPHTPGMRIGLFGGTFNPPHEAHLGACLLAMKRLGLDRVWWLVTPANPLKDTRGLTPLHERIRAIHAFARSPAYSCQRVRSRHRQSLHFQDSFIFCAAAARACISSGSWAPIICAAFTAGRNGGTSRASCRSRSSTGWARAFTPPAVSPHRLCGAGGSRIRGENPAVAQTAGLDLSAWPEIAAVIHGPAAKNPRKSLKPLRTGPYPVGAPA